MKRLFLLSAALLLAATGYAQSESPFFSEDFEGSTHKFTLVNGTQTNQWAVGEATAKDDGKAAYISNDNGATSAYDIASASVVHMYVDVSFPTTTMPHYLLSLDWKGGGKDDFDNLKVYVVETSTMPVAGSVSNLGTASAPLSEQSDWQERQISFPQSYGGTTKRLVLTWQNDDSYGDQPSIAVDNVRLTTTATAPAPLAGGTLTSALSWELSTNGTLLIKGSGAMPDYNIVDSIPWYSYSYGISSVDIAEGVTGIGKQAFYDCSNLSVVSLPKELDSIGNFAFFGCYALTMVVNHATTPASISPNAFNGIDNSRCVLQVPDGSVTRYEADSVWSSNFSRIMAIGTDPFTWKCGANGSKLIATLRNDTIYVSGTGAMADYDDNGHSAPWNSDYYIVSTVAIGSGVTTVGSYAFSNNNSITSVILPEGLETIGSYAFMSTPLQTTGLQRLKLPGSLTAIGEGAFAYCTQLDSVAGGSKVKTIGNSAFRSCSALETITLGKELVSLGVNVFSGCSRLSAINVEEGNTTYSSENGVLHKGNTLVLCPPAKRGSYAIRSGVAVVDSMAFYGCSEISSVSIPASLTTIRFNAFAMCSRLTSIDLGSGVTAIGKGAFSGCTALKAINVAGGNPAYASQEGVLFSIDKTILMQYPAGKTDKQYIIPVGVKMVDAYAFMGNPVLSAVSFSAELETIGEQAFSGTGLTSAILPTGLKSIGNGAFRGCSQLSGLLLPEGLKVIGEQAFELCLQLTAIALPSGLDSIGSHAFDGCLFSEFNFPEGLKTIGHYAFFGSSLSAITLPASLTALGSYAFGNAGLLEQVVSLNLQPPTAEENAFGPSGNAERIRVRVPAEAVAAYKTAPVWINFTIEALTFYNVSFETNGAEVKLDTMKEVIAGSKIVQPATPTKPGYTFIGWYRESSFITPWDFTVDVVSESLTLYAKWEESSTVVAVTGVNLNMTVAMLMVDSSIQLTASITPDTATNKNVSWSSNDTAVASVNNGLVTAVATGSAAITVTTADGSYTASCVVTVNAAPHDTSTTVAAHRLLPLKLYPNPVTNGGVTLDLRDAMSQAANRASQIELYSLSGALVATYPTAGEQTSINVSQLPGGTYIVRVGQYAGKIVIND